MSKDWGLIVQRLGANRLGLIVQGASCLTFDRSFPLIYRAGEFEEQSDRKKNRSDQCLIGLAISAGNADEHTRKLFTKSVACSP